MMTQIPIKLFNTEKREKQELKKRENSPILMYTCGPTIYNFVHIGNLRTFVFEDILRRTILYFNLPLKHVMNLTDVDDKTIKGAIEHSTTLEAFVAPYRKAFFEDLDTLNIQRAEHYPAATEYIGEMIEMIQVLLDKGVAYVGHDSSIYFNIKKFPSYGRLSHLKLEDLKAGASERVAEDEYEKENASDFVLWKAYDPQRDGKIYWDSPFGAGRPGWHIECSAMATKLLGETLDIHVGGVDNMFPHHENEIAQSECCSGKCFCNLWMHSEHLLVDGKKMSKRLGNFYTLRDLLAKGFKGEEIRYLLISSHYRTQLNFTFEGLYAARHALSRLEDLMVRLNDITLEKSHSPLSHQKLLSTLSLAKKGFDESLADDLATPAALSFVFDLVRQVNTFCDEESLNKEQAREVLSVFREFDKVLGCIPFSRKIEQISEDVYALLEKREIARGEKNWAIADECRKKILELGYIIEDTKQGAKLKPLS